MSRTLVAGPAALDLGGRVVDTWAFGDQVPGPLLRATAGDLLRIRVRNRLPSPTTVHWHGIALRNEADGVPGLTQDPIESEASYLYEFNAPDPGTYFYHPHVGVQLDRGLYAPLIIDDPHEPGGYDLEWVLVLDDWVDGTGRSPDEVLAALIAAGGEGRGGGMGAMAGMHAMSGMHGRGRGPGRGLGDAGDVDHPFHLVNGRVPSDPDVLRARPGRRVRLRLINAAADTVFTVALGDHRMTLTHSDGFAIRPRETDAVVLGMGERYDAVVTLQDGVFPLVAAPMGKAGRARALVRTGAGTPPGEDARPAQLDGQILMASDLRPEEGARLRARDTGAEETVLLSGQMAPYRWAINGAPYGENDPLVVDEGDRVRLRVVNMTMMTHPVHVHGHTFALPNGVRKDTVLVAPMTSLAIDLDADNPGSWMTHCHNAYHGEAGMMIALNYRA